MGELVNGAGEISVVVGVGDDNQHACWRGRCRGRHRQAHKRAADCYNRNSHHHPNFIKMSANTNTGVSVTYSIAPMLSVRNGARAVEFYKAAFGAVEVFRIES